MGFREPIHILLVDDRPENLLALEAVLESQQYKLVKANSGEEALRCLLKYEFAVIVLDVQMPGMDGLELQRKLTEAQRHIPIIFITAYPKETVRTRAVTAGAVCFLAKPYNAQVIIDAIEQVISKG